MKRSEGREVGVGGRRVRESVLERDRESGRGTSTYLFVSGSTYANVRMWKHVCVSTYLYGWVCPFFVFFSHIH